MPSGITPQACQAGASKHRLMLPVIGPLLAITLLLQCLQHVLRQTVAQHADIDRLNPNEAGAYDVLPCRMHPCKAAALVSYALDCRSHTPHKANQRPLSVHVLAFTTKAVLPGSS